MRPVCCHPINQSVHPTHPVSWPGAGGSLPSRSRFRQRSVTSSMPSNDNPVTPRISKRLSWNRCLLILHQVGGPWAKDITIFWGSQRETTNHLASAARGDKLRPAPHDTSRYGCIHPNGSFHEDLLQSASPSSASSDPLTLNLNKSQPCEQFQAMSTHPAGKMLIICGEETPNWLSQQYG